ncbi:PIG-L family deacetylase [Ruficoccus amylovorans]|uniref:PIG-L family deacetylase n=1 Tax=Ruficoccus amylovorans TaxID=1804625 RepID=A0A842H9T5_9BACT|nr:PIG-L family deacetylase [Ruficoccus amylovorans]MBC2593172.1 PIG-L family deacetylase [Ruficoccus amylovorans]
MKLFIPDQSEQTSALVRTTHLGVGAHQDDLEFMALHGILECFQRADKWFGAVTCTDGAGSARTGAYADFTDEQMQAVRVTEQETAASIGQYAFMAQLGYPSSAVKTPAPRAALVRELRDLFATARPEVVYTHNAFDKHPTHLGVMLAVLEAIRELPVSERPARIYGCEVWRGLDWLPDDIKVLQDVSGHPNLAAALNGVFDSQIAGGKRYDLAVEGRRTANATFLDAHSIDDANRIQYALDMTPLIAGDAPLALDAFMRDILERSDTLMMDAIATLS